MKTEKRFVGADKIKTNEKLVEGYPIVYNSRTSIGGEGGFDEIVERGAATNFLNREGTDEVLLLNHNNDKLCARRSNGSLTVTEDEHGIKMLADTSGSVSGREAYEMVQNKLITGMSFAFSVKRDTWTNEKSRDLRTIHELGRIYDYSIVNNPAYLETEIQARSAEDTKKSHDTAVAEDERLLKPDFDESVLEPYYLELELLGEQP